MDAQELRMHRVVGNLARRRLRHKACRTCCSCFRKAIQETNRRWIRTQARARNRLRTRLVEIAAARRWLVQRARTLCLRPLQDRSPPKPKVPRRGCERRATLPPRRAIQLRINRVFLRALLQANGSLRTSEAAAPWLEMGRFSDSSVKSGLGKLRKRSRWDSRPRLSSRAKRALLLRPLIHPVVDRLVPELRILRLKQPVGFVGGIEHLRLQTHSMQRCGKL